MTGLFFSILAGILVSIQGVFNTRVSERIGQWETTSFVHLSGFIFSIFLVMLFGKGSLGKILEVNGFYLLGGVFGVIIVYSVVQGISLLGTTVAVAILLVTQLLVSALIDYFGLFGTTPIRFDITKVIGVMVMILGIIIFKWKI
jgi:bacterial/archaeal transporter family-2 protein